MIVTEIVIEIDALRTIPKGLVKGLEDLETRGQVDYRIVEIGHNTEKSPGNVRRLGVTRTLEWKTISLRWSEKLPKE